MKLDQTDIMLLSGGGEAVCRVGEAKDRDGDPDEGLNLRKWQSGAGE